MTHDDSECRGSRGDHDRDREGRVIELCTDSDDRAGREESDGGRNGHEPNLPDDVREATDHDEKEDKAHGRTIGKSG